MTPMLDFTLVCVPPRTSHHAKRIARVGAFTRLVDKPELVAAREMLDTLLLPHQPPAPVPGPVTLVLEFTWPWLVSHSARVRHRGRLPHTSKPDTSNVTKTLEDRLVALRFVEDDRAIASHHLQKWWGHTPGIRVVLAPFVAFDVAEVLGDVSRQVRAGAPVSTPSLFRDEPEAPQGAGGMRRTVCR